MRFKFLFTCTLLACFTCPIDLFCKDSIRKTIFQEYDILTKDKACVLHYLSAAPIPNDWNISISDNFCLNNGKHIVHIRDSQGSLIQTLSGYFISGYFIGDVSLNSFVLKRTVTNDLNQKAFYFIQTDDQLKITYIGHMVSKKSKQGYLNFNLCDPFKITALTTSKRLFNQEETVQNLITVIKGYATNICPNVSQIIFEASDKINYEKEIFARFYLEKLKDGLWETIKEKSFNSSLLTHENKLRKEQLLMRVYALLQNIPKDDRPAFLFGKTKMNIPLNSLKLATLSKKQVTGIFIFHIKETESFSNWVDWPFPILLDKDLPAGWAIIEGSIAPLSNQERKKSGISWHVPGAKFIISKQYSCELNYCEDFHDSAFLIEKKYGTARRFFLKETLR